jgi:tRNA dimethylallyltransferase
MTARVLVLTGPTGVGKSEWALRLAEEMPIEIVSCDSAQVYRGLDIGTAKPDRATRERVPHHGLDLREPTERYSAGDFVEDARRAIADILARGCTPLVVGGTMLYLRALLEGLAALPRASPALRASLDERAAREGWPALHAQLAAVDPAAAARIHPNDPQRTQRALEVYLASGRPISELQQDAASRAPYDFIACALVPGDRSALHARIAARFAAMMRGGFLDEVRGLRSRHGLAADHPSMRAVGYRQLWQHLDGQCDLESAVQRGIAATRQLAKRQLTWLKSALPLEKIDPFDADSFALWRARLGSKTTPRVL